MASTKERGPDDLRQTIKTLPATENAFRALARELSVKVGRTVQHDEVLAALVILGSHDVDQVVGTINVRRGDATTL